MKYLSCLFMFLVVAGCATVQENVKVADTGKNVFDVKFGEVTEVPAEEWNFNFRAYGKSSDWLVSDPSIQRNVVDGKATERNATALHVACDAGGFTVRVLCGERALANYAATTNDFPSPSLEMYVVPDDVDDEQITPHYATAGSMNDMHEYPDLVPDRNYRWILPYMTCSEKAVGERAIQCTIRYDWAGFWDRLPCFRDKRDNFWRLTVMRWTDGGQTWGGTVHQKTQAGYIRWPEFTPAIRDAMMKETLRKAWVAFRGTSGKADMAYGGYPNPEFWNLAWQAEEFKKLGRTSPNYNEDLAFRETLQKMVEKGKAYGPKIAAFDTLDDAGKLALYREACDYLFNFRLNVEQAYGKCCEDQIFGRD